MDASTQSWLEGRGRRWFSSTTIDDATNRFLARSYEVERSPILPSAPMGSSSPPTSTLKVTPSKVVDGTIKLWRGCGAILSRIRPRPLS
jgi:hypothetical protein